MPMGAAARLLLAVEAYPRFTDKHVYTDRHTDGQTDVTKFQFRRNCTPPSPERKMMKKKQDFFFFSFSDITMMIILVS